jgi:hypothetical protein
MLNYYGKTGENNPKFTKKYIDHFNINVIKVFITAYKIIAWVFISLLNVKISNIQIILGSFSFINKFMFWLTKFKSSMVHRPLGMTE